MVVEFIEVLVSAFLFVVAIGLILGMFFLVIMFLSSIFMRLWIKLIDPWLDEIFHD